MQHIICSIYKILNFNGPRMYTKGRERNHKGLSEQRYLQFGVIWREFGARDKTASCRKMDQFIFFENIHEFVTQICRIWGVPIPDYGKLFEV